MGDHARYPSRYSLSYTPPPLCCIPRPDHLHQRSLLADKRPSNAQYGDSASATSDPSSPALRRPVAPPCVFPAYPRYTQAPRRVRTDAPRMRTRQFAVISRLPHLPRNLASDEICDGRTAPRQLTLAPGQVQKTRRAAWMTSARQTARAHRPIDAAALRAQLASSPVISMACGQKCPSRQLPPVTIFCSRLLRAIYCFPMLWTASKALLHGMQLSACRHT